MDPTYTLNDALGALERLCNPDECDEPEVLEHRREAACEKLEELCLWLRKGGFPPKVSTIECGDPNGPEAHGYFIGEFATHD